MSKNKCEIPEKTTKKFLEIYQRISKSNNVFLLAADLNSWSSRKNPKAGIQAFNLALNRSSIKDSDAMLVVKVNGNVSDIFNEIDLSPEILNRLVIINFNLSNQEYEMLLKNVVAIISLHRSEGFGRVPAEVYDRNYSIYYYKLFR